MSVFVGLVIVFSVSLLILLVLGRIFGWKWAGARDKTLWDFVSLLGVVAIPFVVVIVAAHLSQQQNIRQERFEDQRAEAERELAEQRAQDDALQAYLDQMSQLILERDLLESKESEPAHMLAQARTSTAILRLDAEHNESVTRFLTDSRLTGVEDDSVSLLNQIDLRDVNLREAFLPEADLLEADLLEADLRSAFLLEADLRDANMPEADLRGAVLSGADLRGTNLKSADLSYVNMPEADLRSADLRGAILHGDFLFKANLRGAILQRADLSGADLRRADLTDAIGITNEELEQQASSLEGATMPNGQKYEDWLKNRDGGE